MTGAENYGLLALIGMGGGLVSGAVGFAGGILIVPALVATCGIGAMGDAIVVSFFAVLFNSLSSTFENRKARGKEIFWSLIEGAKWYTCGAIGMALAVAILFGQHKDAMPKQLLACLQLLLAASILIPRAWYQNAQLEHGAVKDSLVGAFVGIFIGGASLVGYYGYTAFASASHIATSHSMIDVVGKTELIVSGFVAAPLGVKLQGKVPTATIKNAIVFLLAASSCYVIFLA